MNKKGTKKPRREWVRRHLNDSYVKQASQSGYRSRAVYKLQEIQQKDAILVPGSTVVDLGAAPGSWSQYASKVLGPAGHVIALDILPMEPITGVIQVQGDFSEQAVLDRLLVSINGRKIRLVISDMAPNITGIKSVDQAHSVQLGELALDLAHKVLEKEGDLLIKVFHGEGFDDLLRQLRQGFNKVHIRKPKASRSSSREVYLLARNYQ
ncbi:MAG: RlmE family RNA methyltransferase [Thiohalomonadales bacterium]